MGTSHQPFPLHFLFLVASLGSLMNHDSSRMFSQVVPDSRLLLLDKASPCAPFSFSIIQDVGLQYHRLQLWGRWLNCFCLLPLGILYFPQITMFHFFQLLYFPYHFQLSCLCHRFLTRLYTSSLFSPLNLLLCYLSLRDGDKISFAVKEYC